MTLDEYWVVVWSKARPDSSFRYEHVWTRDGKVTGVPWMFTSPKAAIAAARKTLCDGTITFRLVKYTPVQDTELTNAQDSV